MTELWDSPQLHATNQEFSTELGVDGKAEITGGLGLLAGINVDGEIVGQVQYEHTLLEEGDGASATMITVELGDCKHA